MLTVGIDIGTSYSSISILDSSGIAQPVKVANGACIFGDNYSMPSAAFVDDKGSITIGQLAVSSKMMGPSRFKSEFKRDLGQQVPYQLGPLQLMPEDLYKEIFIHFKKCAEEAAGEKISKTYITYPANYGKKKRNLIELTAKKAGLLDIEMIDEPTAAAYCYCNKGKIKEGDKLLVYDLGGGTFDVALIEYAKQGFKPVTQALGIDKCGGIDIDRYIFEDIYNSIPADAIEMIKNNEIAHNRFQAQIMELSVKIKHQLSSTDSYKDMIPVGFDYVEYELSRDRLNEIIHPLVEETMVQVKNIIKNAGLNMSDISTSLLVGGTSRIPYIRERLEIITGKPAYKDIDPELAVCMGAALWEAHQKKDDVKKNSFVKNKNILSKTAKSFDKNRYGNTVGNISNSGLVALKEGWLYYQGSVHGGLYKVRNNGFDGVTLSNDKVSNINILGDWVYYRNNSDGGKIYKIRTDGTNRTKLNDDQSMSINVVGEWVYYRNRSDNEEIYKIRIDGTNRTKINDGNNSEFINVIGEWIYYNNASNKKIYKIKIDGTNRTMLSNDKSVCINVVGEWIYYVNISDYKTYKIRTDGTNRTKLNDEKVDTINVVGDWIFYRDILGIYKMKIDGTNKTNLKNGSKYHINVVGEWIYYIWYYDYRKKWYRKEMIRKFDKIRIDGTGCQKIY